MQIHIGNLIRNELRRQGRTNEWLAERIGTSTRSLQRLFNKPSIDTRQLMMIGKALDFDFFKLLSDMTNSDT